MDVGGRGLGAWANNGGRRHVFDESMPFCRGDGAPQSSEPVQWYAAEGGGPSGRKRARQDGRSLDDGKAATGGRMAVGDARTNHSDAHDHVVHHPWPPRPSRTPCNGHPTAPTPSVRAVRVCGKGAMADLPGLDTESNRTRRALFAWRDPLPELGDGRRWTQRLRRCPHVASRPSVELIH